MSGRGLIQDARAEGFMLGRQLRFEKLLATLAADFTVLNNMPPLLVFDPGGAARNIIMPLETANSGLAFLIINAATAATLTLNIRNNANNATVLSLTSGATQDLNEAGLLVCDGTRWWGISATNP